MTKAQGKAKVAAYVAPTATPEFTNAAELRDYMARNVATIVAAENWLQGIFEAMIPSGQLNMAEVVALPAELAEAVRQHDIAVEQAEKIKREFVDTLQKRAKSIGLDAHSLDVALVWLSNNYDQMPAAADDTQKATDFRAQWQLNRGISHTAMKDIVKWFNQILKVLPRDARSASTSTGLPVGIGVAHYVSITSGGEIRLHNSTYDSNSAVAHTEHKYGRIKDVAALGKIALGKPGNGDDTNAKRFVAHVERLAEHYRNTAANWQKWRKAENPDTISVMELCRIAASGLPDGNYLFEIDHVSGDVVRLWHSEHLVVVESGQGGDTGDTAANGGQDSEDSA